jgi:hypothetical protein
MMTKMNRTHIEAAQPSIARRTSLRRTDAWQRATARLSAIAAALASFALQSACSKQPAPTSQDTSATACKNCNVPNVCIQGLCEAPGKSVVTATFGSAPGQVKITVGNESATVAPMSFAVREDGLVIVLDQENRRLQAFRNDKPEFVVPLDSGTYEDVAIFDKDRVVLLNRQGRGAVVLMSLDGNVQQRTELVGIGVEEAGLAGDLMVRPDGVWVRYRRQSIRYLNADGTPDPKRPSLPDHLTVDGEHEAAVTLREHQIYLVKQKRQGQLQLVEGSKEYPEDLSSTYDVTSDREGKLYVKVEKRDAQKRYTQSLEIFDANLRWERSVQLADSVGFDGADVFRQLVVTPKGEIYWMTWDSSQLRLVRY